MRAQFYIRDLNLPTFSDCARVAKKNFPEKLSKIDSISHKIDRISPIYFYNKPILPDCEANIARLALFAQQTGTPMYIHTGQA
jgi:hypothetical protein